MVLYLANWLLALASVASAQSGQEGSVGVVVEHNNQVDLADDGLNGTDLVLAFVIFRHGDRTPDLEELDLYPNAHYDTKHLFFPYGLKALTNKGKQRGFLVGQYLRQRYESFISRLYLPEQVSVRTTNYARTKMTALTALAALYPPAAAQKWNPALDWQPIPYDYLSFREDDLMYWYTCSSYTKYRNEVYNVPSVAEKIKKYKPLFRLLTEKTGANVSNVEQVFYLDNLFQALNNVGVKTPKWAVEVMPQIKECTKIEYACEYYNDDLIRISTGVLMADIVNATNEALGGNTDQPKLRLYSAHENNVAALMAAARVFTPHQPKYGATFSLELRRKQSSGEYGIAAVYSPEAGGPAEVIPVRGCGGRALCNYDTFLTLTHDTLWSRDDFYAQCQG